MSQCDCALERNANMVLVSCQVPYYRGERITFDVAPSRMDFKVEHNSLKLEVSDAFSQRICHVVLIGDGPESDRMNLN